MDLDYYGGQCPCCINDKGSKESASTSVKFDADMLKGVLNEIYKEKVDPSKGEIPEELYKATRDLFEKAAATGMAKSDYKEIYREEDFLKRFDQSIETFSAFRVHKYTTLMNDALRDEDGNLRTFEEWKEATASIQQHFNVSHLQTEYNTAVLRSEQAADWKGFEATKDVMPNLKWMPTSSATPREEHQVFWSQGLTLPIDDKFWNEHHPGDLWNCKCWLEQTDEKPTDKADMPSKSEMPTPAKGLENNPGKTAELYSRKQAYYPTKETCIWLKLARGGVKSKLGRVFDADKIECPGNCNDGCPYITMSGNKEHNLSLYKELSKDKEYENVSYDPESGGLKADSIHHNGKSNGQKFFENENDGKGWTGTQLEKLCQDQLYKNGHSCIMMPENLRSNEKGKRLRALDVKIDGIRMDIRSVTTEGKDYLNQVTAKDKQLTEWNLQNKKEQADSICLYFHRGDWFDKNKMIKTVNAIMSIKKEGRKLSVKNIYCVVDGHKEIFYYHI